MNTCTTVRSSELRQKSQKPQKTLFNFLLTHFTQFHTASLYLAVQQGFRSCTFMWYQLLAVSCKQRSMHMCMLVLSISI